ncbi:receptor-type tyrosine-protein phosphatase epsilon-like [Haliotis cracherodii]|uniref:receptor-type tyrosine-protein phosphatase epsilon-like n=1 Tax=Haliotis cracherodii TaxID=6455 RepID=UPI0039E8960B
MTTHWCTIVLVCFGLMNSMVDMRSTRQHAQGRVLDCHCRNKPCNATGDCSGNCDTGWYGNYCQKQNVALNGTATQKGTYHVSNKETDDRHIYFNAGLALDGNTNTTFYSLTCSHAGPENNSWWNLSLSNDHQIKYITIYNRRERADRWKGMEVLVGGMQCLKRKTTPDLVWNVTCDRALTGRNVTITTHSAHLSLCEVQVFVCSDFWFGQDCDKQCNCFNETEICDKVEGQCTSGCPPGFNGTDCLQECVNGTYGSNCSFSCGHCVNNTFCDRTDGICPHGCDDGWTNATCDKACNGTYGKNCTEKCGHCNGTSCNHVDGTCPNGCLSGWNGTTCHVQTEREGLDDNGGTSIFGMTNLVVGVALTVVIIVAVAVAVILLKRRQLRSDSHTTPCVPGRVFNVEDEDEAFSVEVEVDFTEDDDATYCNWVSPYVVLEKLAQYIKRKQEDDTSFENEYKMLPYGIRGHVEEGKKPENKPKNRFAALYPYDESRVILESSGNATSGYINANYMQGFPDGSKYIATQGPTPATVGDFWRMVWQQRVGKIVMVTQLKEMQKVKCERYWPDKDKSKHCGDLTIGLESTVTRTDYTIRKLTVKNAKGSETRRVIHFQFLTWPDHDVPSAPALVSFWKRIKQLDGGEDRPLLVHCSAGVGRTGTFIALDYLMDQAEAEHRVNVFQCVSRMRQARMNMVQTVNQFEFVHLAVLEALESRGTFYKMTDFDRIFGSEKSYSKQQDTSLKKEFKSIQLQRPQQTEKAISDAMLPENVSKNKNKAILPGNKSRPYLSTPVEGYNNYINAVTLPSVMRSSMLIATQTPMENTVVDFWRLVNDHDCFTIVCLDDSQDVERLYPGSKGVLQAGPFHIQHAQERSMGSLTEKTLMLTNTKQRRTPQSVSVLSLNSLLVSMSRDTAGLLELVNRVDTTLSQDQHKVLVHCVDGARMCGVFCGVLNTISRLRLDSVVDIYLTNRELQLARPQFIQAFADYKYCYDMAKEYICSENVYANMGQPASEPGKSGTCA